MSRTSQRKYSVNVDQWFPDYEDFNNRTRSFGYFSEDGASYTVTDKDTPRPWVFYLYNDRFVSEITNIGYGHTCYGTLYNRITRYFEKNYLLRHPNEKRILELRDNVNGYVFNLFNCQNMKFRVTPGCAEFFGEENGIKFSVKVFVPQNDVCECWLVELADISGNERKLTLDATQSWSFHTYLGEYGTIEPSQNTTTTFDTNAIYAVADDLGKPFYKMYGGFGINNCTDKSAVKKSEITVVSSNEYEFYYTVATVSSDVTLCPYESGKRVITSTGSSDEHEVKFVLEKYQNVETVEKGLEDVLAHWKKQLSFNTCKLPDKNLERFLNVWLKYQLGATYRYNRSNHNGGYRDVLQDSWGAMLITPEYGKKRLLEALEYGYYNGSSPRVYDTYIKENANNKVFIDCPLWAPNTVLQYVKDTGDVDFLSIKIPYFDNKTEEIVEEHLWKMCDFVYNARGKNGLLNMLDGDWYDGLEGINRNGNATSAWATMQAFWAQNQLAEIEDILGNTEKSALLRQRSAEYKEIVNQVAWDGNWYVYGFKDDGDPIGSSKCLEGKIYLNPQAWAIFTGIENDPKRIDKIYQNIHSYLATIYGPILLYPPYMNDTTCGRLHKQLPGSFGNGGIYLHGGTFKVFADFTLGKSNEGYDTMMRLMPNHIDNPDMRRTSEPWVTGNVHFGPDCERFGMNSFSWFTATPAWLIHAGFEKLLGVKGEIDGLSISPQVPDEWNEFSVKRLYQGREFNISFRRGEDKGIYGDGVKIGDNKIPYNTTTDSIEVIY